MWIIFICDDNKEERKQLIELTRQYFKERKLEAQVIGCAGWQELDARVKQALPDALMIAQNGVEGLNIVTGAKFLSRRIIWFSDLDFGIQAYRLCVPFFCTKPVTYQKLEQALSLFIKQEEEKKL
ncbi:hypothetical protein [Anaerolentibacter hominis]|uniref:hypothetical protein n=1 Tax=Anaerolentibacter hominis TaxID=3079009 RepID=UPI0031B82A59